jgi:hypothetical protein
VRAHSHRMNRARTREVIDKLAISVIASNAHGIEIHRPATQPSSLPGATVIEHLRVTTGGGIAGNSDQVWLSPPVIRSAQRAPRGPYWNKTQLKNALRAWRKSA